MASPAISRMKNQLETVKAGAKRARAALAESRSPMVTLTTEVPVVAAGGAAVGLADAINPSGSVMGVPNDLGVALVGVGVGLGMGSRTMMLGAAGAAACASRRLVGTQARGFFARDT